MSYPVYHLVLKTRALLEEEERQRLEADERQFEQQIKMLAEQIRCAAIRERTSKGEILVGNRYYDPENPVWYQKAMSQGSTEDDSDNFKNLAVKYPRCQNPFKNKAGREKYHAETMQNIKAQQRVHDAYAKAIAPQFGGSGTGVLSKQTTSKSTSVHVGGRKINIRR